MKKIKRLNQLKNDIIMMTNYAVVDLVEYNNMLHRSLKAGNDWNRMYNIIYNSDLTKQQKYDKLKDILLGK